MAARWTQAVSRARARPLPSGCPHTSWIRRAGPSRDLLPKDRETRVTMATILVVDDEKNYLWMLEELFQGEGYEVLTCERAEEALPLLAEGRVDLLLTDLRMAEMDGMALLGRVREMSPASSTIIMTVELAGDISRTRPSRAMPDRESTHLNSRQVPTSY